MSRAYINSVAYHLPDNILDNDLISKDHPEWEPNKISVKTGILERRITSENEYASDLAILASKKLFLEYDIDPNSIDFILYCTQSPDYFLPTTACIIQDKLGIPTNCGALDFNLGCSGFIYGLSLAKGLINGNMAKKVLLITSETYSKFIHKDDKSNKTIFGDGSAATLISNIPLGFEIHDFVFGTDGSGYENLIVKNGGIRNKKKIGINELDENLSFFKNDDYLYMNGASIFSFTSKSVPRLVESVLLKNTLSFDDINFFLFHQANKFMLDFIRKKINIPEEKFIYHMEKVGNTVSSTIPIALKESIFKKKEGNILLSGFGVGYSWAGCIIKSIVS
jgi:3-oxoacyl-[acyl-carrier-protein] synthase-3